MAKILSDDFWDSYKREAIDGVFARMQKEIDALEITESNLGHMRNVSMVIAASKIIQHMDGDSTQISLRMPVRMLRELHGLKPFMMTRRILGSADRITDTNIVRAAISVGIETLKKEREKETPKQKEKKHWFQEIKEERKKKNDK